MTRSLRLGEPYAGDRLVRSARGQIELFSLGSRPVAAHATPFENRLNQCRVVQRPGTVRSRGERRGLAPGRQGQAVRRRGGAAFVAANAGLGLTRLQIDPASHGLHRHPRSRPRPGRRTSRRQGRGTRPSRPARRAPCRGRTVHCRASSRRSTGEFIVGCVLTGSPTTRNCLIGTRRNAVQSRVARSTAAPAPPGARRATGRPTIGGRDRGRTGNGYWLPSAGSRYRRFKLPKASYRYTPSAAVVVRLSLEPQRPVAPRHQDSAPRRAGTGLRSRFAAVPPTPGTALQGSVASAPAGVSGP